METLRKLLARLRRVAVPLFIGLVLLVYTLFGYSYQQQWQQQKRLADQIVKASSVLSKPMPSREKLQAELSEVNRSLAPMTEMTAFDMLVGIASRAGIDVDPASEKLVIPSATSSEAKVGAGKYRVLSFKNIQVQGDDASVMAFISDLDSGKTLQTMVLKRVDFRQAGEESPEVETVANVDVDIYTKPQG